ncbi:MAG: 23S rRNA (uracil(1939)-C(5))-methyltransferase RlmD, partial [Pseudomonadales bacterium]
MSRRRRRRLPEFPHPLRVEALADDGQGVSRYGEREVRIAGALPGETVRVTARRRRNGYVQCMSTEFEHRVADRVEPFCPHALICGGCTLQHLQHDAQLRHKARCLTRALEAFDVMPTRVLAPVVGPLRGYRRKARLGVRLVPKKGGVLVGFRETGSSLVTATEICPVLVPAVGERIGLLRELISGLSTSGKIPQIEVAAGDDDAAIVIRHLEALSAADRARLQSFSEDTSLHVYLQSGGPDCVHKLAPDDAHERLEYRLSESGVSLRFHPLDFVQVNACVNEAMVAQALALLELEPGEHVADLFCGIGNFSLPMAAAGAHVVGVEGSPELVARARENCVHNSLSDADFITADLYQDELPASVKELEIRKLVLDPPRSGALHVVTQLALGGIERIVYVSCNRDTFARDARVLVDRGFELEAVGVLDMFPHTGHVESMGLFRR